MPKIFEKQFCYYPRTMDYKIEYLVNFGNEKTYIKNGVYETDRKRKSELSLLSKVGFI